MALRDDRQHLLDGLTWVDGPQAPCQPAATLYPGGFDATRFVDVIRCQAVWSDS